MLAPVRKFRLARYHVSVPGPVAYPFGSRLPDQIASSLRPGLSFQMRAFPSFVRWYVPTPYAPFATSTSSALQTRRHRAVTACFFSRKIPQ